MDNEVIIGTCSLCGGPVVIPHVFWSVVSPIPTCKGCGAHQRQSYGPEIDMEPNGGQGFSSKYWPDTLKKIAARQERTKRYMVNRPRSWFTTSV